LSLTIEGINNLLKVIADVHSQHADDLCWMDIDKIFVAAGLPVPDRRVGDKKAMKANCSRFIDVMCADGKWKPYAQLEAEHAALVEFARDISRNYDHEDDAHRYDNGCCRCCKAEAVLKLLELTDAIGKPTESKPGTLAEAIEAIRKAGADAWDDIEDPEEFLGRGE
jgi:hypothetical protein